MSLSFSLNSGSAWNHDSSSNFKFPSTSSLVNPMTLSHRFRDAIINDDLNLAKRLYQRAMIQSRNFSSSETHYETFGEPERQAGQSNIHNQHLDSILSSPARRQSEISNSSTLNANLSLNVLGVNIPDSSSSRIHYVPSLKTKDMKAMTPSQRAFIAQQKSNSNFVFDVRNVSSTSNNYQHSVSSHRRITSNNSNPRHGGASAMSERNETSHLGKGKRKQDTTQSKLERTSSLILAVEKDASIQLIEWLLDQGHERLGEPSRDLEENTIIAVAAYKGRTDVIELYCQNPNLDVPALLDHSDSNGKTALHLAASKGNADVVRLLVDLGADIDLPDREGNTALHYASSWGHLTVVQTLIERGCGFAIKNSKGFTASDFSFTHGVQAAVEAFGREQFEVLTNARKAEARKKAKEYRNRENYHSHAVGNGAGGDGTNGLGLIPNSGGNVGFGPPRNQPDFGIGNVGLGTEHLMGPENTSSYEQSAKTSLPRSNSSTVKSYSPKALRHHPSLPQLTSSKSSNHYLNSFPKISSSDSLFDGSVTHLPPKENNSNVNSNTSGVSQSESSSTINSASDLSSVANKMRIRDQVAMGEYLSKTLNTPSSLGSSSNGPTQTVHSIHSTPIKSKSPGSGLGQSSSPSGNGPAQATPPPVPSKSSPLTKSSSQSNKSKEPVSATANTVMPGLASTPSTSSSNNHHRSQSEGALNN